MKEERRPLTGSDAAGGFLIGLIAGITVVAERFRHPI
jgi:hypothetical protein